MPGFRSLARPRRFKWKFKDFRKQMRNGVKLKHRCNITHEDTIVLSDMEMLHGGRYWPTTDGGLIALPYDSKKFDFNEWVEEPAMGDQLPTPAEAVQKMFERAGQLKVRVETEEFQELWKHMGRSDRYRLLQRLYQCDVDGVENWLRHVQAKQPKVVE